MKPSTRLHLVYVYFLFFYLKYCSLPLSPTPFVSQFYSYIIISEQTPRQMTDVVSSMEQQVCSLWNLVEVLQARVISLEAERGVFFHPTPIPNDGFHHCRAANCNKSFETQASLDAHLRSATGPGHQALLALITQTDCQSRDRKVNKTQASASHESCLHSHLCGKKPANRHERHAL